MTSPSGEFSVEQAIAMLGEHAAGTTDADGPGLRDIMWRYRQQGGSLALDRAWRDVELSLDALVAASRQWAPDGVPLSVAYAVSEMLTMVLEVATTESNTAAGRSAAVFGWRLSSAWEALLAGDAESIAEHVQLEALARDIPRPTDDDAP